MIQTNFNHFHPGMTIMHNLAAKVNETIHESFGVLTIQVGGGVG